MKKHKENGRKTEMFENSKKGDNKLFSYLRDFMDDKGIAAVTPSSKYLVKRVVEAMDLRSHKIVIEYGAADGVMTKRILGDLSSDGKLLALELNETLYGRLIRTHKDPRLACHCGDVREIEPIARQHGFVPGTIDVIISGIPFAFLSGRGRHELLLKTSEMLRPGGRFIAYQVTTHLIPLLKDYFRKVDTQFEVRNIPPHFVFTAFK
jgi:phospholipid N-methyltransferase